MEKIKFNRNYKKLHEQTEAKLVYFEIHYGKTLNEEYVKYDTDGKYTFVYNHKYIVLYFVGNKGIPFSSLRKLNKENKKKYFDKVGEKFKIIVEAK